ncbi:hypothetical protein [Novosphingobium sp.]|uniref:hypothetical protein n=1 Tax=Novosphingobium sp. TaxID=1874826 RepID=UPI0035B1CB62
MHLTRISTFRIAISSLAIVAYASPAIAQANLSPQINSANSQITGFVRNVAIENPDDLALEYQLPSEQVWHVLRAGAVIQAKAIGAIKVRTASRQNFIHTVQGNSNPAVFAPKDWSFSVAGPLAQMNRTKTVCVNQRDCHTVQVPSPDPRNETQIETIRLSLTEQLKIQVNQIGIGRFEDWLGTGFQTANSLFCAPMPYPLKTDQGTFQAGDFAPSLGSQISVARTSNWQDFSSFAIGIANWCSTKSAAGSRAVGEALTYSDFIKLVSQRSPDLIARLSAPDQTSYWTFPLIATDAQLRTNRAAYTYSAGGSLIDSQTLYADNTASKVMVSNGASPHGVALSRALISQFGNRAGVRVFWPIEKRPEAFKRITLFETARIQQSLNDLSVKLSRSGGRTFRIRFGHAGQAPIVDKTVEAAGLEYPLTSMTEGTFVFESRLYLKGDAASPAVAPFVPLIDNEVLIELTAKLPNKIDLEADNPGPNVDLDLKAGQVSVLAKLKFENVSDWQGNPYMRVSLRPACEQARNADGSINSNCAINLSGFQVTSDGGLIDDLGHWIAGVQNTVRTIISTELTNAIALNVGQIDQGILNLSALLGQDKVEPCGAGAACLPMRKLVPIGNQAFKIGTIDTSATKISEALLGYRLEQFPVRFTRSTACRDQCREVVGLKVEPKVTFATNALFDQIVPYATAD